MKKTLGLLALTAASSSAFTHPSSLSLRQRKSSNALPPLFPKGLDNVEDSDKFLQEFQSDDISQFKEISKDLPISDKEDSSKEDHKKLKAVFEFLKKNKLPLSVIAASLPVTGVPQLCFITSSLAKINRDKIPISDKNFAKLTNGLALTGNAILIIKNIANGAPLGGFISPILKGGAPIAQFMNKKELASKLFISGFSMLAFDRFKSKKYLQAIAAASVVGSALN